MEEETKADNSRLREEAFVMVVFSERGDIDDAQHAHYQQSLEGVAAGTAYASSHFRLVLQFCH